MSAPARAVVALGYAHAAWGAYAYRAELGDLARDYVDGVGDGIFQTEHSRDARSTAFWFMLVAPLIVISGHLADAAVRAGDRDALARAGRSVVGLGTVGTVAIPRSGFPAGVALGGWLLVRARRLGRPGDAPAGERP